MRNKYFNKLKSILGLSLSLAKANFKVRNEGSYLGIFWYLLDPLAMFFIILMLGGIISSSHAANYPAYLFLGLIIFNFFRQSTVYSTEAMAWNSGFIKSIKVNSESFVVSGVLQATFSHLFEIIVLLIILIILKMNIIWILFYPIIFFFFVIFSLGFSFILATVGVYVNDLKNVWNVLINLLWFSTPIFYLVSQNNIPLVNKINPVYYFIESARQFIIYNKFPSFNLMIFIILISIFSLLIGILIFAKYKNRFAENL